MALFRFRFYSFYLCSNLIRVIFDWGSAKSSPSHRQMIMKTINKLFAQQLFISASVEKRKNLKSPNNIYITLKARLRDKFEFDMETRCDSRG